MRTKLVLAAALLGSAGVVLPTTSASAVCYQIVDGMGCIDCGAGTWNAAAERANRIAEKYDLPVRVAEMYCLH